MDYAVSSDKHYFPVCAPPCAHILGMAHVQAIALPSPAVCAHCYCCGVRVSEVDSCALHDTEDDLGGESCPPYLPAATYLFAEAAKLVAGNTRHISDEQWSQLAHLIAEGVDDDPHMLAAIVLTHPEGE